MSSTNLRIAITTGDLNGIGIELIIKTLSDNRIFQHCTPMIYGSSKALAFYRKTLHSSEFNFNITKNADSVLPNKVNLITCLDEEARIEPGSPTADSSKYAFRSFEYAIADIQSGKADVLITAPVDKNKVSLTDASFKGHTEYLADKFSVQNYLMLLVSGAMRVGVVTGHIPINQVAQNISVDKIVSKAKTMNASLKQDFGIVKPRIAIFGLNPHAGDGGLIGKEETNIIIPAVKKLNEEGILAFGPYSADGFFGSDSFTKFDGILAMYHDQGLVPFKALAFETGVNYTAGLPFVRTSPDHGPAFDIAGKNVASESSFREAFYAVQDIFHNRVLHKEMNANPLHIGTAKLGRDN